MSGHTPQFCSDIDDQAEAVIKIFRAVYGPDRAGDVDVMKKLCINPACFGVVVHLHDHPTGFIMLQQADDAADIIEICVCPAAQTNGLGRQLLDQALTNAKARQITRVLLEVAVTNQIALKLYRSAGFTVVAKRRDYYRFKTGKVDALVMEYRLS